MTGELAPRAQIVAEAWRGLGEGVEALSNPAGLPLARTTKLVLDPLIVRPVQNPHLARTLLAPDAAAELAERIAEAADDLRATAGWFLLMKQQRRARGITAGNPQEKYFQRAYELARLHGAPGEGAEEIAGSEVDDVHSVTRMGSAELRAHLAEPAVAERIGALIAREWASGPAAGTDATGAGAAEEIDARMAELLDACVAGEGPFDALVEAGAGGAAGRLLAAPGAAREAGLSDSDAPRPPEVGASASKNALPKPFDRSVLERLFLALPALEIEGPDELGALAEGEAVRSALPWQIGDERGRVALAAGVRAGAMDDATEAGRRLRDRWRREAFVRRAERLGTDAADDAAGAFVRRLWVRVHGRGLREQPVAGAEVWDLIDGAMRSVILDRRDRAKTELAGAA